MKKILFTFSILQCTFCFSQTFSDYEITPEGAWCWFADPRALHYQNGALGINATYTGYIDTHGAIKATQFNHLTGERAEVLIRSYFQPDDHNNPTFLALPDGRIMIFYSRHTDEAAFYYRISRVAGDITTLGKEVKLVTAQNTTYPSPFILSSDPTHIYLCWRGIGWHPTIGRLPIPNASNNDEVTFDWGPHQIVRSKNGASGVRPYAKYATNGTDKIYLTYTTTHPDNQTNNWIYFNSIDINTKILADVQGNALATVGGTLHDVDATTAYAQAHPLAVVDQTTLRDWVWQVAMDSSGNPAIAMVRITADKLQHGYYLAKWNGTAWQKTFLANGGGAFHQTSGLEQCYSGGMAIDPAATNIIYCSVPVQGTNGKRYEIIKYTVNADGTVASQAITQNSVLNNARPYIIANSENSPFRLVWMYGNYYDWIVSSTRPLGYPTAIHSNFNFPELNYPAIDWTVKTETFDNADSFTGNATVANGNLILTTATSATITLPAADIFSLTLSPYVDNQNYSGTIFTMGNLSYGLGENGKPFVKIGTAIYPSTNYLGNSDVWQAQNRGTGGQWYAPTKFHYFHLALTCANGKLYTYVNGLIDQYIEVEGLQLGNITLGGFKGWIADFSAQANGTLRQDEIKDRYTQLIAAEEDLAFAAEYNALTVPDTVYSDIVLKSALSTGDALNWQSSNATVLNVNGLVTLPLQPTRQIQHLNATFLFCKDRKKSSLGL